MNQINAVTRRLRDPNLKQSGVAIESINGSGKTALALMIAWDYVDQYTPTDPDRFDAIVYLSAKSAQMTAAGSVARTPDFAKITDIYDTIAQVYNAPIALGDSDRGNYQALCQVIKNNGRLLLVLDSLDEVRDSRINTILLASSPRLPFDSKILVTSRKECPTLAQIRLPSLSDDEMTTCVRQAWQLGAPGTDLDDAMARPLVRAARGLPLAAQLVAALAQMRGADQAIAWLTDTAGTFYVNGLGASLAQLQATHLDAYRLLVALSFFDQTLGATKRTLCILLDLIDHVYAQLRVDDIDKLLAPLSALNLAYRDDTAVQRASRPADATYLMPITVQRYIEADIPKEPRSDADAGDADDADPWIKATRKRWLDAYLRLAKDHGGKDGRDWAQKFKPLHNEWPNLARISEWCRLHRRYDEMKQLWLAEGVDTYADLYGEWDQRWASLVWLGHEAEARGEWSVALVAFANAGWISSHRGRADEARGLLSRAQQNRDRANDPDSPLQLELLENQIEFAIRQRQYDQARGYLGEHRVICNRLRRVARRGHPDADVTQVDIVKRAIANRWYYYGMLNFKTSRLDVAARRFRCAITLGEDLDYERVILYGRNWLVDIAVRQGQLDVAKGLLQMVERGAADNDDVRRIGYAARSRGMLSVSEGNLIRARAKYQKAIKQFEMLGMVEELAETQSLLDELPPPP